MTKISAFHSPSVRIHLGNWGMLGTVGRLRCLHGKVDTSLWSTDHFPLRGYTILRKHPPESGLCDRLGSSCVSAPCIPAQPLIA